jgi:hypothetical protein
MSNVSISTILWIAAAIVLVLLIMRRRKRKANFR